VDDLIIGENWLSPFSRNVGDYRSKLHAAMLIAQSKYLERRGERRVHNQRENLLHMRDKADYLTVNPKINSLALEKRRMLKESRGAIGGGRLIERYFVIDNQLIIMFNKEGDQEFQKQCRLEGAYVFVESRSQYDH
jgi:hypothetical protein